MERIQAKHMNEHEALDLIRNALCEVAPQKAGYFARVAPETELRDLGIDSVRTMEMVGNIEDRLARTFEQDAIVAARTVGHVIALILTGPLR